MIVDLLRNDIVRIARSGRCGCPRSSPSKAMHACTRWSRRVTGGCCRIRRLSGVFAALFPCGSVTGAPRRSGRCRSSASWSLPRATPIAARSAGRRRTGGRVQRGDPDPGPLPRRRGGAERRRRGGRPFDRRDRIRGGPVESALRRLAPGGLRLIETFRRDPEAGFVRLQAHLARWRAGRRRSGSASIAGRSTGRSPSPGDRPLRLRLTLGLDGAPEATARRWCRGPQSGTWPSPRERLDPADPWLRVKTTAARALRCGSRGAACGVRRGVFPQRPRRALRGHDLQRLPRGGDGLLTPRLGCGLLPGVFRQQLLRRGRRARRRCCGSRTCGAAGSSSATRCAGSAPRALPSGRRDPGVQLDTRNKPLIHDFRALYGIQVDRAGGAQGVTRRWNPCGSGSCELEAFLR